MLVVVTASDWWPGVCAHQALPVHLLCTPLPGGAGTAPCGLSGRAAPATTPTADDVAKATLRRGRSREAVDAVTESTL